jgi:oligoribonuclease
MLVWVDTETTGLDFDHDLLLEVGMVITTDDLEVIDSRYYVIKTPRWKLRRMIPFVRDMHTKSGLLEVLRMKAVPVPMRLAELEFIDFMVQHEAPLVATMAGSSVHFDRRFLDKFMPDLAVRFGYRILDVSSIREVVKRWLPHVHKAYMDSVRGNDAKHRTLDDCFDSIAQLRYYRNWAFSTPEHDYLINSGGV